jgi:hypothetical protein
MATTQKTEVKRIESQKDLVNLMPDDVILVNGKRQMVYRNNQELNRLTVIFPSDDNWRDHPTRFTVIDDYYLYKNLNSEEDGSVSGKRSGRNYHLLESPTNRKKLLEALD